MQVVERKNLGKALIEELGKVEVSLNAEVSKGILLDYGSGIKEWLFNLNTALVSEPTLVGDKYFYVSYYTLILPAELTFTEFLSLTANIEGNDKLKGKTCTVKKLTNKSVRLDYSGISTTNTLTAQEKKVTLNVRVMGRTSN